MEPFEALIELISETFDLTPELVRVTLAAQDISDMEDFNDELAQRIDPEESEAADE